MDGNLGFKSLRKRAEAFLSDHPSALNETRIQDFRKLVEELAVHQVELEMQNEELQRAYLELSELKDKFENLCQFIPVGYLIVNPKGVIEEVNLTACQMFNKNKKALIGTRLHLLVEKDNRNQLHLFLRDLFSSRLKCSSELSLIKQKGESFYAQLEGLIIDAASTAASNGRIAVMDITSRKHAENELQKILSELEGKVEERTAEYKRAKLKAEESDKLKSEFLANVSHELRTPMHAILHYSKKGQNQNGQITDEKNQHYFRQIRLAAERLMRFLDNLLDLSSLEAKKMAFKKEEIDALHLLEEVLLELQPLYKEKNLDISIKKPKIQTKIVCDAGKLAQVFENLLSNAIRFSPSGGMISVLFSNNSIRSGKNSVPALKVTICDQGVGIPEEELISIFDKFTQSTRTKSASGGTGLGLAICKEIIEGQKGRIWAENNPEKGATFKFILPYKPLA